MKLKKYLLGDELDFQRKIFFWNMMGSGVNALATLVLQVVVTRLFGEVRAGIFLFAYPLAQQLLTLGGYEMRPYQATDVKNTFSFGTYLTSRFLTGAAMMAGAVLFLLLGDYTAEDACLIFLLCTYKLFDALEDVFHGMFQQRGRLDIAGRALTLRVTLSTAVFVITLLINRNMLFSTVLAICAAAVGLVLFNIPEAREFVKLRPSFSWQPLKRLLMVCFPLCAGTFMLQYISTAPRLAIRDTLSDEMITYFGILFMPNFVINLFTGFAFKPLLTTMASSWVIGNRGKFRQIVFRGMLFVLGFTVLALAGAAWLGIPVLSRLYHVHLDGYLPELLVLLLGGGFNAASVILYYAITVMRRQKSLVYVYAFAFLIALFGARPVVMRCGLMGACVLYTVLMAVIALLFWGLLLIFSYRDKNKPGKEACP